MKEKGLFYITWLSFILLMPFLVTCMFQGSKGALWNKKYDMESCVPLLVSMQIPENYEKETIEAQTVIARTNLYYELERKSFFQIIRSLKDNIRKYGYGYVDKVVRFFSYPHKKYVKAALNTYSEILLYQDTIKLVPYHLCSGGKTRNGEEVFYSSEYSYLKVVNSGVDKESEDYIHITYISEEQLPGKVSVNERDQAGYVLSLNVDNALLEGESFRKNFNLPSSNFSIQKKGIEYQIVSRGVGHGIGFSQYGGNALAKNGKKWEEILEIYFPALEIGKI